ncbi:MAG: (d)CMP kinase [Candidatus Rhabdochlamydia sp.]
MVIITIDGPAGTGKTTVAQQVAKQLHLPYFDTGAMYRGVTIFFLKHKVCLEDHSAVQEALCKFHFTWTGSDQEVRYFIDEEDVTEALRSQEVTQAVSAVAASFLVREALWKLQRQFAREQGGVFEGRDMGSVVFPCADFKFFLIASPEIRARRRWQELQQHPSQDQQSLSYEQILEQINHRDHLDSSRKIAPLKKTLDSQEIDTSYLSLEAVVDQIVNHYRLNTSSSHPHQASWFYKGILFFARLFFKVFYRLKVKKLKESYPQGAILAPNHTSFFDPPAVAVSWPYPVHFVAKASLFKHKLLGKLIRSLNAHPVTSSNGHAGMLKQCCELLKQGHHLMIFPEGTRSLSKELAPLKQGVAYLAYHSQTPIIPVYIQGTYEVWGKARKFPKLWGAITVVFGSPIFIEVMKGEDLKEAQARVTACLQDAIQELKQKVELGQLS